MWKLIPPRQGHTPYWSVRGKYCGIQLNQVSTGTGDERAAKRIVATWRKQAELGTFRHGRRSEGNPASFATAAIAYMRAGGQGQFLPPIIREWGERPIAEIDQIAIDTLAEKLYPTATAATRNRQVYTPISAVLKRAGIEKPIKRPLGWKGKKATSWLEPEQAFALLAAADEIEPEFGLLCRFLLYTGMRLGEALSRQLRDLNLDRAFCYLEDSKTGEPRGCHLPVVLLDAMAKAPFLDERNQDAKLFRYHDGGYLRGLLAEAMTAAGLSFPRRQRGFHLFCHTYGTWLHRYGGLDTHGLTRTGRWANADSADRYVHTEASVEAKMSERFPTPAAIVGIKAKVG